jgi:hypothetical protein
MNTNELDQHISKAWGRVIDAAKIKDLVATQRAVREVAESLEVKEQAIAIQQRMVNLTKSNPSQGAGFQNGATEKTTAPVAYVSRRKRPTIRPSEVRIGSYRRAINYANQIPIVVANWLIEQKKELPRVPNFIHPTNAGFARSAQTKELADGSYIEVGDHQEVLIQKARKLLDACGYKGTKLEVLLDDGTLKTN